MSLPPPSNVPGPVQKLSRPWFFTGLALVLVGIAMLPTVVLAGIGIGCIIAGVGTILAAFIRSKR